MTRTAKVTLSASLLLALCMATSVLLLRHVDQVRPTATLDEVLYLPSPKIVKRLSLGYDGLMADIYWTRAVQYFGNSHANGATEFKLLAPLLEIATTLDPHLIVAYEFGANFTAPAPPAGAGEPQKAIALSEFGIRNNPNEWRLYNNLGFIYYLEMKDYAKAADAFLRGSKVPGAHPFLSVMAGRMADRSGDLETARMIWEYTYESSKQAEIRANAGAHLRAIVVDEDVTALETLTAKYKDLTGHFPAHFSDLEAAGLMRGTPIDPIGHPYKLAAEGRVEVVDPDNLPFIQKGMPPGYVPPAKPKFLPSDASAK